MANYNNYNSQPNPYTDELSYDLRAIYARMVGMHMLDIYAARKNRDYAEWLRNIDSLFTVTAHKIESKKTIESSKNFEELREEVIKVINKYREVFLKNSKDSKGITELEEGLMKLEKFIYHFMDKANIFGSKRQAVGL